MSADDTHHNNAPGYRAIRFNTEWITRPLFGFALAGIALGALILGPNYFAGLVIVMSLFAAREWHRMVRTPVEKGGPELHGPFHIQTITTTATIAAGIVALLLGRVPLAFAILALGTVAAFAIAARRGDNPLWQAGGVLYIGLPAFALAGLRAIPSSFGVQIIVGLFVIVWATDTGALVFGSLIGGPRLAPAISPGKTWSGTIGGSFCASAIFAAYIGILGHNMFLAALFAFFLSFVAHGGDLFESFVKRRFSVKDSGSMIPGHGGTLDRVDSTFAASVVLALLVFVLHLNPLFGGHP